MRYTCHTLLLLVCLVVNCVWAAGPQKLVITGLSQLQEAQVRAFVNLPATPVDFDDRPAVAARIVAEAAKSLEVLGHYHASGKLKFVTGADSHSMHLRMVAGAPTTIATFDLSFDGPLEAVIALEKLRPTLPTARGKSINHQEYEQTKNLLFNEARNLGYLDARYLNNRVLIHRDTRTADIKLALQTGSRYRLGKIAFDDTLFNQQAMERWLPFRKGAYYDSSHLHKLTYQLQKSGYFSSVTVTPELARAKDGVVPVSVELQAKPENILGLGIGYASDTGARVRGDWLRPHHNRFGHQLQSKFGISDPRQELTAEYRIPYLRHPANNQFKASIGIQNSRTTDTFAQLRSVQIGDHRRLARGGWYRDLFLRWEQENFSVSTVTQNTRLLLPGISFSRTATSGRLYPDSGAFLSAQLFAGSTDFQSDINLLRFTASAKLLQPIGRKHSLLASADIGAIGTSNFSRIPVSHRFFAGGEGSVRGFAYQSLSPSDDNGIMTGGQFLTTATIEYHYKFINKWSIAGFIDSGRAYRNSDAPFHTGIGAGLRWRSPVGPIRIDLASDIDNSSTIRLHLAIGPRL